MLARYYSYNPVSACVTDTSQSSTKMDRRIKLVFGINLVDRVGPQNSSAVEFVDYIYNGWHLVVGRT